MTLAIPIDDPADPRIDAYRSVRERDLVGRRGLFIAEGEVVVRVLLARSLHPPVSLLLAEKRLAALSALIKALPDTVPVFVARQAVMDEIAGYHIHRGILAVGRRAAMPDAGTLLAKGGTPMMVMALFGIANHDNIGGLFRNAAAFGADAVVLDSECCDPLYRKAIRVSVGAALTVPFARLARDEDVPDLLAEHGFTAIALSPRGDTRLTDFRRPDRVAALFGAEGPGLPATILDRVRTVRIPMAGELDSLNVATASGIVLHHLAFGPAAEG